MKCYIATFYQYENYGTRLQNFALCQAIQKAGAEPVTLVPWQKKEKIVRFLKEICSFLPTIFDCQRRWLNQRKKRYVFRTFTQQLYCLERKAGELHQLDFSDAVAITGSDQVWSPVHFMNRVQEMELYFLRFAPPSKRYAYAPSFGEEEIPQGMKEKYEKYISEMRSVSVREKSGQRIIFDLVGKQVPVLPDPVFLLGKEDWRMVIRDTDSLIPENDYIIVYFLSRQSGAVWQGVKKYAHIRNVKIICIAGNTIEKGMVIPTPDLFVNLIGHAQAVFTDSFHGTAFSIIMQTPFLVFPRKEVDQLTRLHMLLETYQCPDALVSGRVDYHTVLQNQAWNVEGILKSEQKRGLDYIKHQILNQDGRE